jgi:hypothetical protein
MFGIVNLEDNKMRYPKMKTTGLASFVPAIRCDKCGKLTPSFEIQVSLDRKQFCKKCRR